MTTAARSSGGATATSSTTSTALLAEADPSAVVVDIEPLEGRASTTSPKVAPEGGGRMLLRVRRDVKFRHTRIILIILVVVCLAAFGISTAV